jgi:hypothetical protein
MVGRLLLIEFVQEITGDALSPTAPSSNSSSKTTGSKTGRYFACRYKSTQELRDQCANGTFKVFVELQSDGVPPVEGSLQTCERLSVDLGPEYESLEDRAVELEKELCATGQEFISHNPPQDAGGAAAWREFKEIGNVLEARRNAQREALRNAQNALEQLQKRKREERERVVPGWRSEHQPSELQHANADEINRKYA